MTKEQAFKEINETQEFYINELIKAILDSTNDCFKTINFTSPTGTGKTNMMSLLCNKMPEYYFVITTLSKGQLNTQIRTNMKKLVKQDNFVVYGLCDFTANTKLQANEILSRLPKDKKIIWLRDEGHINTNKWQEIINNACFKIINFSATNKEDSGIKCNFTNTMMLRTVHQDIGTPEDALDKLLEVKKQHKKVKGYNPCAIMRCLDTNIEERIINACNERNLSYINITTDNFDMSDLCKDDNEYDVILNKFKIVEGIDLRRAHVIYMTNEPSNIATTIQVIGRCRRNALLYRNDIDIFTSENKTLLKNTRQCYVYYNIQNMEIARDETGELCQAFCDRISCQELKENSVIHVDNGQMNNGLYIIELENETGDYRVEIDPETGFNIIKPEGDFYKIEEKTHIEDNSQFKLYGYTKEQLLDTEKFKRERSFNFATGEKTGPEFIIVNYTPQPINIEFHLKTDTLLLLKEYKDNKYRLVKRACNKRFAVDIFEKKQAITLSYIFVKTFCINKNTSIGINLADSDCEKKIDTKYFVDEQKANDFITQYKNKKLITKLNIFSSYTYSKAFMNYIEFKKTESAVKSTITLNNFNSIVKFSATASKGNCTYSAKLTLDELNAYFDKCYFNNQSYFDYKKINNDQESAIVGTDLMKFADGKWIEDRTVTGKISRYSKLNTFIQNKYAKYLTESKVKLFNGKNNFKFDTRCNSCLGYLVEYYSKYLVYGKKYLGTFIEDAMKESKVDYINDYIIIRACMLKYRKMMTAVYGSYLAKVIKTISTEQLIKDNYKEFVETVIALGKKTAEFVKEKLNITEQLAQDEKLYDPNLSIRHIAGLADYITKDTIIDIKTTNNITEKYIKQVLAYHYLSTKRSDLDIKRVIVYDAVSGKSVEINL